MKRPAGVTVIAVLSFATGAIYLLQGLQILGFVVFGPGHVFTNVSLTGWMTLVTGLIWLAAWGAFLSLQPWAWLSASSSPCFADRGVLRQPQRLAVR